MKVDGAALMTEDRDKWRRSVDSSMVLTGLKKKKKKNCCTVSISS